MPLLSVSVFYYIVLCILTQILDQGRRIAYGTSDGVYFSNGRDHSRPPLRVLALQDVTQIDILEEYQLLIVLSGALHRISYVRMKLTSDQSIRS